MGKSRTLKDVKYENAFTLNEEYRYADDPEAQTFEMLHEGKKSMMVFEISFVRNSMAYDEDLMYQSF